MQYAGQPADQQLLEHNRAGRLRSDRLRATAAYPRACMAAAEREPRETTRARRTNSHNSGFGRRFCGSTAIAFGAVRQELRARGDRRMRNGGPGVLPGPSAADACEAPEG